MSLGGQYGDLHRAHCAEGGSPPMNRQSRLRTHEDSETCMTPRLSLVDPLQDSDSAAPLSPIAASTDVCDRPMSMLEFLSDEDWPDALWEPKAPLRSVH